MFERVIAWDTEWTSVDRKRAEAVVLDCACFNVGILVLPLILRCFLSILVGVLASVKS